MAEFSHFLAQLCKGFGLAFILLIGFMCAIPLLAHGDDDTPGKYDKIIAILALLIGLVIVGGALYGLAKLLL